MVVVSLFALNTISWAYSNDSALVGSNTNTLARWALTHALEDDNINDPQEVVLQAVMGLHHFTKGLEIKFVNGYLREGANRINTAERVRFIDGAERENGVTRARFEVIREEGKIFEVSDQKGAINITKVVSEDFPETDITDIVYEIVDYQHTHLKEIDSEKLRHTAEAPDSFMSIMREAKIKHVEERITHDIGAENSNINKHLVSIMTSSFIEKPLLMDKAMTVFEKLKNLALRKHIALALTYFFSHTHNYGNQAHIREQVKILIAAIQETEDDDAIGIFADAAIEMLLKTSNSKSITSEQIKILINTLQRVSDDKAKEKLANALHGILVNNSKIKLNRQQVEALTEALKRTKDVEAKMIFAPLLDSALYNNPKIILTDKQLQILIQAIRETPTGLFGGCKFTVVVSNSIRRNRKGIDQPAILEELINITNSKKRKNVYYKIIEPLFFKNPNLFTVDVIKRLTEEWLPDVPEVKYLLFYVNMNRQEPTIRTGFILPWHLEFHKVMSKGKKKIAVWHNIKDGMGDELVRTGTLVEAFLNYNPDIEVTIYTNRGFLYSHPRVTTRDINNPDLQKTDKFDAVIHFFTKGYQYSDESEAQFQEYLSTQKPFLYVNVDKNKGDDKFEYKDIVIGGNLIQFDKDSKNVYTPTFRLCAELGLPFRFGTNKSEESLFIETPYKQVEEYWNSKIEPKRKGLDIDKKPIIMLNVFGGSEKNKGYDVDNLEELYELVQGVKALISQGYVIVILPNHQPWGGPDKAKYVVDRLSEQEKGQVIIAPSPKKDSLLHKYLVAHLGAKDMVVTVEGGLMHLAYNLEIPFYALINHGSGSPASWLSPAADCNQTFVYGGISELTTYVEAVNELQEPISRLSETFGLSKKEEQRLLAEHNDEDNILMEVNKYLADYFINIHVDLDATLQKGLTIDHAKEQLDKNMETLARKIARHTARGLKIRCILENDTEDGEALALLRDKLECLSEEFGISEEKLLSTIGGPFKGDNVVKIILKTAENIEKMQEEVNDWEFVVSLTDDSKKEGIPVPNYTAAMAIGLAQAALRVAAENVSGKDNFKKFDAIGFNTKRTFFNKIKRIYKRYGVIGDNKGFVMEDLKFMVVGCFRNKLTWAKDYALPPIVKDLVEKINRVHEIMQRVLQAA